MGAAVGFAGLMASPIWVSSMYRGCAKQHPNIPKSPRRLLRGKRIWERDRLRKTGVEVREGGGGRYRVCNTERESMGTPGANKSHDIIVWQGARSGVARSRGREGEGKGRAPTVTHSASRGPSCGMDKSRTMRSQ